MLQHFWDMFRLYSIEHRTKAFGGEQGYSKFYGSLDAFHDTDLGLFELSNMQTKIPLLSCLGFLQALVTQQNIVKGLGSIFDSKVDFKGNPISMRHRTLRNRIAGHPQQSDGKISSFFPSTSRSSDSFEVVFYGDENESSVVINVSDFINEHRNSLKKHIEKVTLAAEEVEFSMFQESPYETCQDGKIIGRNKLRWREFNSYIGTGKRDQKFSATAFYS